MKELLIYQLEVALCLTLFYLFYRGILRKETNFQLKRLFIIFSCMAAFVLPALNIQYSLKIGETSIPLEYLTMIPAQIIAYSPSSIPSNEINMWAAFSLIWGTGFSIMVLKLLFSLYLVNKILKEAIKEPEGQRFKITNTKVQSFSFFKTIVLNTHHYQSKAMKYILAHERAHSDQYHSVDVLFLELLKALQWFNPIAWLLAKESIQNLEYLADKEVMTSMKNMHDYQMAIVQYSHHTDDKLIRSEFSKSNLKNRIIMMNQPNNRKIHIGRFLLLLPIIGVLFMSFSIKFENLDLRKEISELLPILNIPASNINEPLVISSIAQLTVEHEKINDPISKIDTANISDNKVFKVVSEPPYPSTGDMDSYYEKINDDLNYPSKAMEKDIKGKVFVQFIVQKDGVLRDVKAVKGIGYGCDEEAVRVIKNGPLWVPGKDNGEIVDVRMILPVYFGIPGLQSRKTESRIIKGIVVAENGNPIIGVNVTIKGVHIGTVSDGEGRFLIKTEPEHTELVFAYIDMQSQTVGISDEGDYKIVMRAEDGYVAPPRSGTNGITIRASGKDIFGPGESPLYIVDGKVIEDFEHTSINPEEVESVKVLKNKSAITQYGEKGKNGVIIITLKDGETMQSNNSQTRKDYNEISISGYTKTDAVRIQVDGNMISNLDNPPLVIRDGVEISVKELEKINPKTIDSVSVFKGESALKKYGEKGKNGVILIKMKE